VFAALQFPPIDNLVKWPAYFGKDQFFEFNKIALISVLAVVIPAVLFLLAKKDLVPSGLQNVVESTVEFVEKQVVLSAIGPDGLKYLPLLLSIFLFVFFGNIFEVIPTFQMPANARMANPVVLAVVAWVTFIGVGIKSQGFGGFMKSSLFPPGVPKALYILVTPIEFLSTFLLRPFRHLRRAVHRSLAEDGTGGRPAVQLRDPRRPHRLRSHGLGHPGVRVLTAHRGVHLALDARPPLSRSHTSTTPLACGQVNQPAPSGSDRNRRAPTNERPRPNCSSGHRAGDRSN
jgi:F-type H+-transporting ATPase subunit a